MGLPELEICVGKSTIFRPPRLAPSSQLTTVAMSAGETGLVALLVTPIVGTVLYELCEIRCFKFGLGYNLAETLDVCLGEEDVPLESSPTSIENCIG